MKCSIDLISSYSTVKRELDSDQSLCLWPLDGSNTRWQELHLLHLHLYLNCGGRCGTTVDFSTSFLHFPLFSTALWDLANSRPVRSLMLSSNLFFCLLVFFPLSLYLARWFWLDLMDGRHVHTTSVCVSLRWSGGLCVVRLPAGSWHRLPQRDQYLIFNVKQALPSHATTVSPNTACKLFCLFVSFVLFCFSFFLAKSYFKDFTQT